MKLVIVTGMSGAGKTIALKILEDLGFYCVDNLPIPLMEPFADLAMRQSSAHEKVALGIDIRSCLLYTSFLFLRHKKGAAAP